MPESSLADLGFEPVEIDSGLDDLGFEEAPATTPVQATPPAVPPVQEQPEEPGRITKMPQTAGEWGRMMLGGVLHPIRQAETLIEQFATQTGLASPGSRLAPGVSVARALEQPLVTIPQIPQQEGKAAQIGAGLGNAVIDFANFFGTPEGIGTLGLGSLPAAARKVILADFAGSMATSAPEQFAAAYQSAKEGKLQQAAQQATGGAGGVLFSTAIGRQLSRPSPTHPSVTLPRSLAALERTTEEFGAPPFPPEEGPISAGEESRTGPPPASTVQEPGPSPARPTEQPTTEAPSAIQEQQAAPVTEKPATGKGIAGAVRGPEGKWARATSDETGAFSLAPLKAAVTKAAPVVKAAIDTIKDIGEDALTLPRTSDYRRSVLNWSAKLQRSFDEASSAQKEIENRVPDPIRQDGITNWIQAGGDAQVLQQRAAATVDPKLKKGYEAALNLTPDELAVATDVKAAFDMLGQRGQRYSVLNSFIDNYAPQIWDLGKTKGTGSSRTLREKFKFSKARTFDSFFDGEQAGFTPKTKEIGKLLPVYLHEMNSVIAARQLVEQLSGGVASDGRPLVAPRGTAVPTQGQQGAATLVMPKILKGDVRDYKSLENQPALTDWRWAAKDSAGNPVFLKADLALHPEAYNKIRNVLGRSRIREWYRTRTSAAAEIPKKLVHGLDWMNSETKRTMLGFLAPFHQVQEATHAVGHRINPAFNIPKVDLVNDAAQMDAARHGLMLLPDTVSESQFMEGLRPSGLLGEHGAVSKIPGVGKLWSRSVGALVDSYSEYLFKSYIPGLKYKTYQAIVERNTDVYSKELASGKYKPEDIKILSAEQANAAYGHLNYADLARNPTMQHLLQLGLLAPDFLEARGRFAMQSVKGATGAKVGREQLVALGFLAASQAVTAWTLAQLTGGEWDAEHPFEFRHGSRKYTMRSVPEDVDALRSHTRSFVRSRLSPIIGKGAVQYGFGTDYGGRKVSAGQTTRELATAPLPLTVRVLPGVRELSGEDRPGALRWWEQLAGSVGVKISRYNPRNKITEIHSDWLKNNPDPKIQADYEESLTATYPVSKYKELDAALADRDETRAVDAIAELRTLNKDFTIFNRMNPYGRDGVKPLFHESAAIENKFLKSLNEEDRSIYEEAKKERRDQYRLFLQLWRKRGEKPKPQP